LPNGGLTSITPHALRTLKLKIDLFPKSHRAIFAYLVDKE
jgi:hypothetical protein